MELHVNKEIQENEITGQQVLRRITHVTCKNEHFTIDRNNQNTSEIFIFIFIYTIF